MRADITALQKDASISYLFNCILNYHSDSFTLDIPIELTFILAITCCILLLKKIVSKHANTGVGASY